MRPRLRNPITLRRAQTVFCLLAAVFMLGPIFAVLPISFSSGGFLSYPLPGFSLQWYERLFEFGPWLTSLRNSLVVGVSSAVLATLIGTLAALGLSRGDVIAQQWILGIVISPMIVPLVVSGVAMYFFLAKLGLVATFPGLILAHTVLGVPFVVVPVLATLRGFDANLVRAAQSLGASPFAAFRRVTLPSIAPGVISGALFAFATSFDEVVVAIFIAGPEQKTLPRQMFEGLRDNIEPTIIAMSSLLVVIAALMLATTGWLLRKS